MAKKAVQSPQELEIAAELRHILDSIGLFLWHADVEERDGEYHWAMRVSHEEAARRVLPIAVPPGETWSTSWYNSKVPEDSARCDQTSVNALTTGANGYTIEYRCRLANGDLKWFFEDALIEKKGPGLFHVMGAAIDITNLKKLEADVQAERRLLRTVIDSIPDFVFVKDVESRFVLDNVAHLKHFGAETQEELTGKSDFDFYSSDIAQPFYEDEQAIIQRRTDQINKVEFSPELDGRDRWSWTTKVPLHGEDGSIIGLVGINRDITARRQEEMDLKSALDAVKDA